MNDFVVDDEPIDLRDKLKRLAWRVTFWAKEARSMRFRDPNADIGKLSEALALTELLGKRKLTLADVTVMSAARDPYRLGDAGHDLGQWFADKLGDRTRIHLRGLHYVLVSAGNVYRLDGKRYVNNDECWRYLCNASGAARWLKYIAFNDIIDERNDKPFDRRVITGAISEPSLGLRQGDDVSDGTLLPRAETLLPDMATLLRDLEYRIPDVHHILRDVDAILPSWKVDYHTSDDQPFRIIMMGEKTSLKEVLAPLADRVNAELVLDTGDPSLTHIAGVAERASRDYRPAVVLFFSDFDPTGYAMPRTLSRRFQALKEAFFPSLNIRVHQVALTLKQVIDLELPSAPIKESELRKANWIQRTGREQTEIDALAALRPDVLRRIGDEAVAPFYDPRLPSRINHARQEWIARAKAALNAEPAYIDAREAVEGQRAEAESVIAEAIAEAKPAIAEAIEAIQPAIDEAVAKARPAIEQAITEANQAIADAVASVADAQAKATQVMESVEIEMPEFEMPEPDLPPTPEPLWSTEMSDIEATRKLLEHKLMVGGDPDEEEEEDGRN